jgi:hypothetical protein
MTFPETPLDRAVELYIGGSWVDVTDQLYLRDAVTGFRGVSSESSATAEPSRHSFTLKNHDYRWSPRNPTGPYFGLIGRNTPVRHSVRLGPKRGLFTEGTDYFEAADSAALSITGDLDLRADVTLDNWRPGPPTEVFVLGITKSTSYGLYITRTGLACLYWSTTGADWFYIYSTEPIPGGASGRKSVRGTLDVDNGAGGYTVTFYYSDSGTMSGTWVAFGDPTVTTAGTTSIYNSATGLRVKVGNPQFSAEIDDIEVRSGIGGTIVAKPDFPNQAEGATTFADAYSNTWVASGNAVVTNRHYLFHGEVSSWPPDADKTGTDVYTQLDCSGITRRLVQGDSPVPSPYYRGVMSLGANLVAYWPLEVGDSADWVSPGTDGTAVGQVVGEVDFAAYSGFVGSAPIAEVGTGQIFFPVPAYAGTGEFQVRCLVDAGSSVTDQAVILRIGTGSSFGRLDLVYNAGGSYTMNAYTNGGALISTSGPFLLDDTTIDKQKQMLHIGFTQNGADVDILAAGINQGDTSGLLSGLTASGVTLGACTYIYVNPAGVDLGGLAIGHLSVEKAITTVFALAKQFNAYTGESATVRMTRLCTEKSVPLAIIGAGGKSEMLGHQGRIDFVALLREAATSDGGILSERRDASSLLYRTCESLARQDPVFTLSYADECFSDLKSADDDRDIRNKVTVTRASGASATVTADAGPLSVLAPPDGVGEYDEAKTMSLARDAQAKQRAAWAVHLGTVDEPRWPSIEVNLAHPHFAGNPARLRAVLSADIGDRIVITHPPPWVSPESIDVLIGGVTLVKSTQFEHRIRFNVIPARPFELGAFDSATTGETRYANDNTAVNGVHTSTTTSLSVDITTGPLWTHADGDFDVMVAGERMTVTGVAGATSPQTFTVTRSMNGVVKAQADGAAVSLADPSYFSK